MHGPCRRSEYRVGTCISVDLPSLEGHAGEAGGDSLAQIVDIVQDRHGSCHVCVTYFWRWVRRHGGGQEGLLVLWLTESRVRMRPTLRRHMCVCVRFQGGVGCCTGATDIGQKHARSNTALGPCRARSMLVRMWSPLRCFRPGTAAGVQPAQGAQQQAQAMAQAAAAP